MHGQLTIVKKNGTAARWNEMRMDGSKLNVLPGFDSIRSAGIEIESLRWIQTTRKLWDVGRQDNDDNGKVHSTTHERNPQQKKQKVHSRTRWGNPRIQSHSSKNGSGKYINIHTYGERDLNSVDLPMNSPPEKQRASSKPRRGFLPCSCSSLGAKGGRVGVAINFFKKEMEWEEERRIRWK